MRIIAGRFKGHRLPSPRVKGVRPTTDRVREAVFSALGTEVYRARVLELFAGTGAFGFEALSRGAAEVVFVERERAMAIGLVRTAAALGVEHQVSIMTMAASRAVKELVDRGEKFRIIFLDPPYRSDLIPGVVCDPLFPRLLDSDGLVLVEREALAQEPRIPPGFRKSFKGKYGGTIVEIFDRETEEV